MQLFREMFKVNYCVRMHKQIKLKLCKMNINLAKMLKITVLLLD